MVISKSHFAPMMLNYNISVTSSVINFSFKINCAKICLTSITKAVYRFQLVFKLKVNFFDTVYDCLIWNEFYLSHRLVNIQFNVLRYVISFYKYTNTITASGRDFLFSLEDDKSIGMNCGVIFLKNVSEGFKFSTYF